MVEQLKQIIVYVSDMNRSLQFYQGLLQLAMQSPKQDDYSDTMWVELDGGGCTLALHGGSQGSSGDVPQIVFRVNDVEETRMLLSAHDIACGPIVNPAPGTFTFAARDPDGNVLGFKQMDNA